MALPSSHPSFFAKVSAARVTSGSVADYSAASDPDGTKAHAFVSGLYGALTKEAGLDEAAACGFLRALAELGQGRLEATARQKQADLGGVASTVGNVLTSPFNLVRAIPGVVSSSIHGFQSPPGLKPGQVPTMGERFAGAALNPLQGKLDGVGQAMDAAGRAYHHPGTFMHGGLIATSSPTAIAATDHIYGGNYAAAAGDVAGGVWNSIKEHSPQWLQGGEDWLAKNVTPDNLKAIAPHVMAGLGTYAAGRMLGMGNVGSAALGLAGGYGLPKLYDGLSSGLAPAVHPGAVAPAAASTTPAAPAAPVQTQAQANLTTSSGTADAIAAKANQPAVPVVNPPVTGRRVP